MRTYKRVGKNTYRFCLLFSLLIIAMTTSSAAQAANENEREIFGDCQAFAERLLGKDASVVKIGHLTRPGIWEAVLAVPLKRGPKARKNEILLSRGAIIERVGGRWSVILRIGATVANPRGTIVGVKESEFHGFVLTLDDTRGDDQHHFTVYLHYLDSDLQPEDGIDIEINWNQVAGRYQEFAYYQEPMGFKEEQSNR